MSLLDLFGHVSVSDWTAVWSSGVTQSLVASVIFAILASLITPLVISRREAARFANVRRQIKEEMSELLTKSISGIENISFYIKNDAINVDDVKLIFDAAENVHVFCEHQIRRVKAFRDTFYILSEGLEPDERYNVLQILKSWRALDVDLLRSVSNSSLGLMRFLENGGLAIDLHELVRVRAVKDIFRFLPSEAIVGLIELNTAEGSGAKSLLRDEKLGEITDNFSFFMGKLSCLASNNIVRAELVGSGYLSDVTDLPELAERNLIVGRMNRADDGSR